jgi:hypothetical protein
MDKSKLSPRAFQRETNQFAGVSLVVGIGYHGPTDCAHSARIRLKLIAYDRTWLPLGLARDKPIHGNNAT